MRPAGQQRYCRGVTPMKQWRFQFFLTKVPHLTHPVTKCKSDNHLFIPSYLNNLNVWFPLAHQLFSKCLNEIKSVKPSIWSLQKPITKDDSWLKSLMVFIIKVLPLCVYRKQAEVGSPDDRSEVRGSQGTLSLQEQQQTEWKPPSASQRQERPQRSVCDVITLCWHHWCHVCTSYTIIFWVTRVEEMEKSLVWNPAGLVLHEALKAKISYLTCEHIWQQI